MRIITGDECGLLKEVIPELCRPSPTTTTTTNASAYGDIHAGRARPSATSIQAAASSYGNNGHHPIAGGSSSSATSSSSRAIQRLEPGDTVQGREGGIVSLAFLSRNNNNNNNNNDGDGNNGDGDDGLSFEFAALRMNGIVETWSGNRHSSRGYEDDGESNVTAATYRKRGGSTKGALSSREEDAASGRHVSDTDDANDTNNNNANKKKKVESKGWYTHQPIRPIGMVSTASSSSSSSSSSFDNSHTKKPILATCDSIGTITLIDPYRMSSSDAIVARYNAFFNDNNNDKTNNGGRGSASPIIGLSPSSSGNDRTNRGVLTYTKGGYANANICTSLALCGGRERLGVGGRERGARVLDLESGRVLWKAKNLPPDSRTLLQQPMWTTTMQFLHTPTSSSAITANNNDTDDNDVPTHLLATGTAYRQVQIYDIRAHRRPALYTPEGLPSHRATALCQLPDGNTLAVGDSVGDCHLLDVRKLRSGKRYVGRGRNGRSREEMGLGRLVGPGGSIRQLAMHPAAGGGGGLPYLACVGLDRKLWTWDVTRRKMVDCVYLRQRLNCLLFCEDGSWDYGMGNDDDDDDEVVVDNDDGGFETEGSKLKRERELDAEEDEVKDYVGSEDEDDDGKGTFDTKVNDDGSASSEQTASDSTEEGSDVSEGVNEGSDDDDDDDDDDASTASEEEPSAASSSNPKKKRRK